MKMHSLFIVVCATLNTYIYTNNTSQNLIATGAGCHVIPSKMASVKEINSPKKITSVVGASLLGILSGIVMIGALPLVKHTDALGSPLSYALLASALLYSTYDITRRSFGPEYASIACWNSLTTMVTGATILLARE